MSQRSGIAGPGTDLSEGLVGDEIPTLEGAVAARIRRAILDGTYLSGERLVEERLADDFGVSRNPVRAALRELAAGGLVTITPRRGASVTRLTADEALEMFEIRAALDGLAARRAARHPESETLARVAWALAAGREAAASGDDHAAHQLIDRFHVLVAEAGGSMTLARMLQPLADKVKLVHAAIGNRRAMAAWDEHADILEAIQQGDADRAEALARGHVDHAMREYIESLERRTGP